MLVIFRLHVLNKMITDPEYFMKKNVVLDFDRWHDQYMAYLKMKYPNDPNQWYCNICKVKEDSKRLKEIFTGMVKE